MAKRRFINHASPTRRALLRCSTEVIVLTASPLGCTSNIIAPGAESTETVGGSESEADSESSGVIVRPDLGSDAVVCGEPGDTAGSDEALQALVGCEIYRGRIGVPHPSTVGLSPLASLRVIEGQFSSNQTTEVSLEGPNQLQWVGAFVFSQGEFLDLSPMSNLEGVDDVFGFFSTTGLTNGQGLESLRTVGGGFGLTLNEDLASVDGFSGLEWIGGDARIALNPKLQSLAGFSRLRQVDGDLTIQNNDSLPQAEIDALLSRLEVGGDVILD